MSIRVLGFAVAMALALSACEKAEEVAPAAPVDTAPTATLVDAAPSAMQSAAMELQDTTAALNEAASAAVGMATEVGKR